MTDAGRAPSPVERLRSTAHRLGWTDMTTALVVFTADDKMLRRMDVATGPCVPVAGRALVGPSEQMFGDTFEEVAALCKVLTSQDQDQAFEDRSRVGRGELRRMAPDFAKALGALAEAGDYQDRERRLLAPVAERWWVGCNWPRGMERGGLVLRLNDWAMIVADGLAKGRTAYCWRGPSVEMYAVVDGER